MPDRMSAAEAAKYLGVNKATLANWRSKRKHIIPYIKIGHLVQYKKSDLDAFIERQTFDRDLGSERKA